MGEDDACGLRESCMKSLMFLLFILLALLGTVADKIDLQDHPNDNPGGSATPGALIPASATMVTAWDVPRNPLTDSTLDASPLAGQIRRGFTLFTDTPHEAPQFSLSKLSCNNCHLNAGQKAKAMPLV